MLQNQVIPTYKTRLSQLDYGINCLSLFDGMSCGRIALERAGIKVNNYFASEVDKHVLQVSTLNYPFNIQLGSVVDVDVNQLDKIDLLIGGSPCQSFSFAGKQAGMSTKCKQEITDLDTYIMLKMAGFQFEGQSYLFWEYIRILIEIRKTNPDVLFLLENVKMSKKWQNVLSKTIGVEPILINSALVSAQNRKRLYWTNIPGVKQPEDKGILLKDVIEPFVPVAGNHVICDYFYGDEEPLAVIRNRGELQVRNDKSLCLCANYFKGPDNHGQRTQVVVRPCESHHVATALDGYTHEPPVSFTERRTEEAKRIRRESMKTTGKDFSPRRAKELIPRTDNKMNCLTATYSEKEHNIVDRQLHYRKLTPLECERLQTVPEGYTSSVSNSQRYKMLGNGWTIDVIVGILAGVKLKQMMGLL